MSAFLDLLADEFPQLRYERDLAAALEQATTPTDMARAMVTMNPDGTRTVDERAATTVPALLDEIDRLTSAARSVRDRAAAEVQIAWPRLTDTRTPADQCTQVVNAVRALPLLPDADTTPDVYVAARGDAVETWLKAQRNEQPNTPRWRALDDLLDNYRLHADTGVPLDQHTCEGRCADCASGGPRG